MIWPFYVDATGTGQDKALCSPAVSPKVKVFNNGINDITIDSPNSSNETECSICDLANTNYICKHCKNYHWIVAMRFLFSLHLGLLGWFLNPLKHLYHEPHQI